MPPRKRTNQSQEESQAPLATKPELLRQCETVNDILKHQADELRLGCKESLKRMDEARNDPAMFRYWGELELQEFIRRALEGRTSISMIAVINDGARMLKISPATAKRYMQTLRAKGGPFSSLGDILTINGRYTPVEEEDYWKE